MRQFVCIAAIILLLKVVSGSLALAQTDTLQAPPPPQTEETIVIPPEKEEKKLSKGVVIATSVLIALTSFLIYNVRSK